jgi:replicative DNA helicase
MYKEACTWVWSAACKRTVPRDEVNVTHSKTGPPDSAQAPAVAPVPPAEPPADPPPPRPALSEGFEEPLALGSVLDEALERMERRARGDERPVPLPWSNVAAAIGGGLWGGTLNTLVGDTGTGKTQFALQAAIHAAEAGVPVCYVAPDSGIDQMVARIISLKAHRKWSDLYAGRSGGQVLEEVRNSHGSVLKDLPFHLVGGGGGRSAPKTREIAEWMRAKYAAPQPGARPFLLVLDFVQLLGGTREREDLGDMMARAAYEARQCARELDASVLLVSTTSRETRAGGDDTIGIHRDRRQPSSLGRGNPARLVLGGKETGDVERESDTVLVLAQEPWKESEPSSLWTRVWCAVAKNRSGARAWCALRFNGTCFDVDREADLVDDDAAPAAEDERATAEEE